MITQRKVKQSKKDIIFTDAKNFRFVHSSYSIGYKDFNMTTGKVILVNEVCMPLLTGNFLSPSAIKVFAFIWHRTIRYDKLQEVITLRDFQDGIYSDELEEWIADPIGLAENTIIKAIKELVDKGLIYKKSIGVAKGHRKPPNRYTVLLPNIYQFIQKEKNVALDKLREENPEMFKKRRNQTGKNKGKFDRRFSNKKYENSEELLSSNDVKNDVNTSPPDEDQRINKLNLKNRDSFSDENGQSDPRSLLKENSTNDQNSVSVPDKEDRSRSAGKITEIVESVHEKHKQRRLQKMKAGRINTTDISQYWNELLGEHFPDAPKEAFTLAMAGWTKKVLLKTEYPAGMNVLDYIRFVVAYWSLIKGRLDWMDQQVRPDDLTSDRSYLYDCPPVPRFRLLQSWNNRIFNMFLDHERGAFSKDQHMVNKLVNRGYSPDAAQKVVDDQMTKYAEKLEPKEKQLKALQDRLKLEAIGLRNLKNKIDADRSLNHKLVNTAKQKEANAKMLEDLYNKKLKELQDSPDAVRENLYTCTENQWAEPQDDEITVTWTDYTSEQIEEYVNELMGYFPEDYDYDGDDKFERDVIRTSLATTTVESLREIYKNRFNQKG